MRSRKRSLSQLVLLYVFLQFLDLYSGKDADVEDGIMATIINAMTKDNISFVEKPRDPHPITLVLSIQ